MTLGPTAQTPDHDIESELGRTRLPRGFDTLGNVVGSHYVILGILADDALEHTVSRIATALDVDLSTASRQISHAARLGLLTWTTSPHDRRVRVVGITDSGRQALGQARRARRLALKAVLVDWTHDEIEEFLRLTRRFNDDSARRGRRERARAAVVVTDPATGG